MMLVRSNQTERIVLECLIDPLFDRLEPLIGA